MLTIAHLDAIARATPAEGEAMLNRLLAAADEAGVSRTLVLRALAEAILPTPAPVEAPASTITLNVVVPGTPGEEEAAAAILEALIPGAEVVGFQDVREERPVPSEESTWATYEDEDDEPVVTLTVAPAAPRRRLWRL